MGRITINKSLEFEQLRILATSKCNLNCTHCYQHFDKNNYYIEEINLIKVIDFAHKHKVKNLTLSGGEIFTYPSLYSVIEYCLEIFPNISIATNGTMLNLNFFKTLLKKEKISFQISLDGNKENHDKRRGKGTYDVTLETIKNLTKIGYNVIGSMAIDEHNFTDMIDVISIPELQKINFLPVAYVGAAKNSPNVSSSNFTNFEETMFQIYKKDLAKDSNPVSLFPHSLAIKYDGTIYPSAVAQDLGVLCMGNIYCDDLEKIVERALENNFFPISFETDSLPKCKDCEYCNQCSKGSRERAFKSYGSLFAPDPFCCRIYKNSFKEVPLGKLFWGEII